MVSPTVKQIWVIAGILMNMLSQGLMLTFPYVLVPALQDPDSKIKADLNVASWIASCVAIAGFPGFLASSIAMDRYGRKGAHIILMTPGLIGWICIYFSSNITTLIIGRLLSGFTGAATVILGAISIGEYSSPKNRGMFLNLKTAIVCLGNMSVHILANYMNWNLVALAALVPQAVAFLIVLTWPESPAWLASKRRFEASEKSFYWLRGKSAESKRELEELIRAQKEKTANVTSMSLSEKTLEFFNKFTKRDFIQPTLVITFCGILLEACGRHYFAAYAMQIIDEVTGTKTNSFYFTLGIDTIITVSSLTSSILVRVMKRRTILFYTGFAALFTLVCVCLYLFLSANGIVSKDKPWIPITMFSVYFILSNLGCTAIPLALMGELYPLAHRGAGSAVCGISLSIWLMIAMQLTPHLLVSIKVYGTFAVYGTAMFVSLLAMYYTLPETKDKTLQEIEYYFNFGKFRDETNDNEDEVKMKMLPAA
ncbi:facilitated trehalose transporter Tret1-like [Bicyclus anynana]|uniref:Facilitated trehalose transporter Tret1-like n=1 Tax=Bicyclus anynana TaxID=110368 RepID=A0A6J1N9F5_BICAN|nr:facilitated trehalose transporter Tret1-like [Bicyclus anynana]